MRSGPVLSDCENETIWQEETEDTRARHHMERDLDKVDDDSEATESNSDQQNVGCENLV